MYTTPSTKAANIACVDDHWLVAECLRHRIEAAGYTYSGTALCAADLAGLVERERVDLALVDVKLADDPFQAVAALRPHHPWLKTLFLTAEVTHHVVRCSLDAGASGVFCKVDPPEELIEGVQLALNGRYAFGESVKHLCPALRPLHGLSRGVPLPAEFVNARSLFALSEREQEVLRLMAQGLHRSGIARELHRSPKTIDKHRAAVMRKLDIRDRAELVLYAVREGIVRP